MAYQPIENYGIIGDMRTVALVGMNGSIDWFCFPHFDSPSVFAAILDEKEGGHFRIAPTCDGLTHKQFYWPETNVLITRFFSADGVGEVMDYMTAPEPGGGNRHRHRVFRRVNVVRGTMPFRMECCPAFNYGRDEHTLEIDLEEASFYSKGLNLGLSSSLLLKQDGYAAVRDFALQEGQTAIFILQEIEPGAGCAACLSEKEAVEVFIETVEYWRRWLSKCTYTGRWREIVHWSALALKLLTFEPTGAIVTAPTCSLPEAVGGERNWDYRYTWIRDAAFTLYGLLRIGFAEEAGQFMQWLEVRLMFEQMLGYANHLGLYAEQTGYRGEALGNFPQAFTHLALISAAYNLDKALGKRA